MPCVTRLAGPVSSEDPGPAPAALLTVLLTALLILLKVLPLFPLFLEGQLARGSTACWLHSWGA